MTEIHKFTRKEMVTELEMRPYLKHNKSNLVKIILPRTTTTNTATDEERPKDVPIN